MILQFILHLIYSLNYFSFSLIRVYYLIKLIIFFFFLLSFRGSWKTLCSSGIQSSRFPDNTVGADNGYVSRYQDLNSTRVQMIRGNAEDRLEERSL